MKGRLATLLVAAAVCWTPTGCSGRPATARVAGPGGQSDARKEKPVPAPVPTDVQQVCQLTIDLPELDKYYHSDLPGRRPLRVVRAEALRDTPVLIKFGQAAVYISPEDGRQDDKAYIEFTRIEVGADYAEIEFRYPVEGIRGTVHLRKTGGAWKVQSSSLAER
jgi:hypothetical protein